MGTGGRPRPLSGSRSRSAVVLGTDLSSAVAQQACDPVAATEAS